MATFPNWVPLISCILLLLTSPQPSDSESDFVKQSLIQFMETLSGKKSNPPPSPNWGWNQTSDPCSWAGVICGPRGQVIAIILDGRNLNGTLNATALCAVQSLNVLFLRDNGISGELPQDIANCAKLTHLLLRGNRFVGPIPDSIRLLTGLKHFVVSKNYFTGSIPAGLGRIASLVELDVSKNGLVGRIPSVLAKFNASGFEGNPGLCGRPLPVACPPAGSPAISPSYLVNY